MSDELRLPEFYSAPADRVVKKIFHGYTALHRIPRFGLRNINPLKARAAIWNDYDFFYVRLQHSLSARSSIPPERKMCSSVMNTLFKKL